MYAHAPTYPSLHASRTRRLPVRRPHFFSRKTTRHVRATSRARTVARPRAMRASWLREIVRVTMALANIGVWATTLYLVL
jgi:hypothetical protein